MDKVLLIDGHNALWRACVKFKGKSSNSAPSTLALAPSDEVHEDDSIIFTFNFFRNLRFLIEQLSPDKCFFVLEGHPQFRYDLYANYKANRIIKYATKKDTHESFVKTKEIILPLLQFLPMTTCHAAAYEADDVIATLCENMRQEDLTVLSSDSDYIQLLQRGYSNIRIYNPIKKVDMEAPPYPYVIWKCLNGDTSDNIPGLLKPKKALETTTNSETFKKFMDIEENRANFNINRQLIDFRMVPEEEIILQEGVSNFPELRKAFAAMKFESIVNDSSWKKYYSTFECIKF